MTDYVSRQYLLDEYDRQHQGPPGGARKIIAEAPAAAVIDRREAIEAACKGFCHPGVRCPDEPCREQTKYLRELPPADVNHMVYGKWFDVGSLSCRCDQCGRKNDKETPFYPNCGAKMDMARSDHG